MKGVVFTEFLEMVEETFSDEMADRIIDASDLPSQGAYTSLGTYDHHELIQLVTHLSQTTGISKSELITKFGEHLFQRFVKSFPQFFENTSHAFDFLKHLESYIHMEVRKLYSDAELPQFTYESPNPDTLIMNYSSSRPLGDLAEGLIIGCIKHFDNKIDIVRENLPDKSRTQVCFILTEMTL